MWSAATKTANQFVKNLEKSPGWFSLVVVLYVLLDRSHASEKVSALSQMFFSKPLVVPEELLVVLLAGLAYVVGDALDEGFYKDTNSTEDVRACARFNLGVDAGVYKVALSLTSAAEKKRKKRVIWLWNETSKLLRSLGAALLIFGVALTLLSNVKGLLAILLAVPCLAFFSPIKNLHKRALYRLASELIALEHEDRKDETYFESIDVNDIRFFFWDGEFVTAHRLREEDTRIALPKGCVDKRKKRGDTSHAASYHEPESKTA